MSSIRDFEIGALRERFGLSTFVETGCFQGDGIAAALEVGFESVLSCDISLEFVERCRSRFGGNGSVTVHQLDSLTFLDRVLPTISGPTLFWLDAHFPHVFGLEERERSVGRFPLPEELARISALKADVSKDVVVADDLRVIADPENSRWRAGELPHELVVRNLTIAKLIQPFKGSHNWVLDGRAEGALVLTPRSSGSSNEERPHGSLTMKTFAESYTPCSGSKPATRSCAARGG